MSKSTAAADPADLLQRWLDHQQQAGGDLLPEEAVDATPAATEDPHHPVAAGAPSAVEAGRAVLAAFAEQLRVPVGSDATAGLGSAAGVDVIPVAASAADSPDVPPVVASAPVQEPPSSRRPPVSPAPGSVSFPPRRGVRRALTLLTVTALAATVVAGLVAWSARTTTTVAVAGGLLLVTWLLSSLRTRATGTEVSVVDGVLWVRQGNSAHRFNLAGAHPPIDILGAPDDRGWKVLVQRRGMGPYVITRRMVDPQLLSDAIRAYRPNA